MDASAYYAKAAQWAAEQGMASGSTFSPSAPCTRMMAVEFINKQVTPVGGKNIICEPKTKLAKLILQMKAEIAALRTGTATEYPDGVSPKKKQLAAYLQENPGVSNKSYIARQLGMAITTVQKYYDEVRAELAVPAAQ